MSTVRRWLRRFKDGELGQADLNDKTRRKDFKNWCGVGGSELKRLVILWKNNYAALKIIDVGIFLFFYFIKIYFPVHFIFVVYYLLRKLPALFYISKHFCPPYYKTC